MPLRRGVQAQAGSQARGCLAGRRGRRADDGGARPAAASTEQVLEDLEEQADEEASWLVSDEVKNDHLSGAASAPQPPATNMSALISSSRSSFFSSAPLHAVAEEQSLLLEHAVRVAPPRQRAQPCTATHTSSRAHPSTLAVAKASAQGPAHAALAATDVD